MESRFARGVLCVFISMITVCSTVNFLLTNATNTSESDSVKTRHHLFLANSTGLIKFSYPVNSSHGYSHDIHMTQSTLLHSFKSYFGRFCLGLIVALVTSFLLVPVALVLLLCCCGCVCEGVVGGSCASAFQSAIGNVESGSPFSTMQSMGAGGSLYRSLFIGLLVGVPAGILSGIYSWPDIGL